MPRSLPTRAAVVALALVTALATPQAVAKQIYYSGKGPAPKDGAKPSEPSQPSPPLPPVGPLPPVLQGRPELGVGWALRLGCVQGEVGQKTTYQLDSLGIKGSAFYVVDALVPPNPYEPAHSDSLLSSAGFVVDNNTGELSGTPASAIAGSFTYTVYDLSSGQSGRSRGCFQFAPSPDLPASGSSLPRIIPPDGDSPKVVQQGEYFELNFSQVYGFYGNIAYSIKPEPPKGLTFVNGVLSGQIGDSSKYDFQVRVVDSRDSYAYQNYSVNVINPQPLSPQTIDDSCVSGKVGDSVDLTPFGVDVPSGQNAVVTYTLTDAPPGVALDPDTGALGGHLQSFSLDGNYKHYDRPIGIDVAIATWGGSTIYSMSVCTDVVGTDPPWNDNSYPKEKVSVSGTGDASFVTGQRIDIPGPTAIGFPFGASFSIFPPPPPGLAFGANDGKLTGALAFPANYTYQITASDGLGVAVTSPATIKVTEKPEGSVVFDGAPLVVDTEEGLFEYNPFVVDNLPANARWSVLGDLPPRPNNPIGPDGKPYPGMQVLATTGDLALDLGFVVRGTSQDDPARYCTCDGNTTIRYYPTVRTTWTEQDGSYREVNTTIPIMLKIVDFKPTQP